MATINMPKKEREAIEEAEAPKLGQGRPILDRYRLSVDRQTKATYKSLEEAEKRGKAIKKAFPVVQVAIYDAEENQHSAIA